MAVKTEFRKRTDKVFMTVFVVVFVGGIIYGLRAKLAASIAAMAAFLVAGVWLVMVEDVLSDKPDGE